MSDIKYITVRFNLNNPIHLKAWEHIRNIDNDTYKSYSEAAVIAIADYFDRKCKLEKDPYFETRQKEDDFVNKIVAAVGERLDKAIPNFILSCLANFATAKFTPLEDVKQENTSENTEIDWDFLGDE